jgi:hypothetical protein
MGNIAVTLGGVAFQGFEVPQRIEISGGQHLAIHDLIGGGRVVDALGQDAGRIEFSGAFSGSDASIRAQLLDAATALGAQLPLFWDGFFYTVVIEKFEVDYEKPWWIPFSLTCAVVVDPAAIVAGLVSSVASLIGSDVSSALSLAPQGGVSLGLTSTPSASDLANAQSISSAAFSAGNESLTGASAALNSARDAGAGVTAMNGLVAAAGQVAALTNVNSYLQRASVNMANELL